MSENAEKYVVDLCPRCHWRTTVYAVTCGDHVIPVHACPEHGDVIPVRGMVCVNTEKTKAQPISDVFAKE